MKIRKFNESQNWSESSLIKFFSEKDKIDNIEKKLRIFMKEFLINNISLLPEELKEEENIYFDVYELEYSYDNLLEVSIFWHDDEHDKIYLDKNQFKKFIDLLNDPDIYKNAKKYNL